MTALHSLGLGIGTQNSNGNWLEVFYPKPLLAPAPGVVSAVTKCIEHSGGNQAIVLDVKMLKQLAEAFEAAGEPGLARLAETRGGDA